ncbi:extracellular solute-binding protein [Paenibacillus sp. J5C_2022]|uniref:extracellular solute-binding protein n=1 Tax=Paenibacillus sp. J5C2022 TaxID=2977129 RepID=UPI0021D0CF54|nr:extracellular solute-binding protein [Paenibacillus sp. J5C2022]MCU6710220.1 extracellular solute-binding protein [Paenibacillus sp. J5C2022]
MNAVHRCVVLWMIGISVLLTGGCSSLGISSERQGAASQGNDSAVTIRFMYPLFEEEPVKTEAWNWIEQKFNIKYEPIAIPVNSYSNRLQAAATSMKPPDALVWTSFPHAELTNLIRGGKFHALDDMLSQFANLDDIPREIWDKVKVDGKIYGIPRPRALVDQAVIVRKDWLDALDLPVPTTLEDYRRTAIAFTHSDPDGNGKPDTYGFAAGEGLDFLHELKYAFGAGNGWSELPDGSLVPSVVSPEQEAYLHWLRQLYRNGGIDSEFSILQPTEVWNRFIAGKTGIIISEISTYAMFSERLSESDPEAELIMLGPPAGPEGHAGFQEKLGFYGLILIPSSVPMEKVERILSFIDWQASDEGMHMRRYGLEGVHHERAVNGDIQYDRDAIRAEGIHSLFAMNDYDPYFYVTPDAPAHVQAKQREMLDAVRNMGVTNPAALYISDAELEIGTIYSRSIRSYRSEFVRGELPEDALERFREEWLRKGGQQAIGEVNAWYRSQ